MHTEHERLVELFSEARAKGSAEEREVYLREACGDDALRHQVEILLQAHFESGDFLEPAAGDPLPGEGPGTVIDHYKLLERIGEGGFGVVFMAEQLEPVRRRVALKIVKAGMDTREVIARFEAERQALAVMEHPNIARVFEAGATESGRPYFAMELVQGVPITTFCDANSLPARERLELFLTVCMAVQHAHQKGIIHRDLKPSNIMVTLHDGKPVPKVIDFGTAKALQQPLTERTMFTGYGKLIGTPAYMSPEQAELSGLDVDTRADIYSLGVLLYELLTGSTPIEANQLRDAAFDEMMRIIRHQEPPRPSTRVSTLGVRATEIASQRRVDPNLLQRSLRGDLDWIVMKALEKDRARRYASAGALLEDLQRHLADQPVEAGPPGAAYRTHKFLQRHRLGVGVAAAVSLALGIGLVFSLIGFTTARKERDRATVAATNLKDTLVRGDLATANRLFEVDEPNKALAHLARALRNDPTYQPAAMRLVSALTWRGFQVEPMQTLQHKAFVADAELHEGGRLAQTLAEDGTVKVWDAETGKPLATFGEDHPLQSGYFLAREDRFVGVGRDGGAWLWRLPEGELIHELAPASTTLNHARLIADDAGRADLAWISDDGTLNIMGADGAAAQPKLMPLDRAIESLQVSGDGQYLAARCRSGALKIWEWPERSLRFEWDINPILPGVFNEEGSRFLCAAENPKRLCWVDLSEQPPAQREVLFDALPLETSSKEDTSRFIHHGFGEDGQIITLIHGTRADEPLTEYRSRYLGLSPDGSRVIAVLIKPQRDAVSMYIATLEADTGQPLSVIRHPAVVATAANEQTGFAYGLFVTRTRAGTGHVWNLETGEELTSCAHSESLIFATFSPEGERIAFTTEDHAVRIWDIPTGNPLTPILQHGAEVSWFGFSPDGERLVTASLDQRMRVWNARNGEPLTEWISLEGYGTVEGFSPDGTFMLLTEDAVRGEPQRRVFGRGSLLRHALRQAQDRPWFRPGTSSWIALDDNTLLHGDCSSGKATGTVSVVIKDVRTGEQVRKTILPHAAEVWAFDRGLQRVALAETNSGVHVYDTVTGKRQVRIVPIEPVRFLQLSADGSSLLTSDADCVLSLWDLREQRRTAVIHDWKGNPTPGLDPMAGAETAAYGDGFFVYLSRNGDRCAIADKAAKRVTLWDVRSGARMPEEIPFDAHMYAYEGAALSHDGSLFLTAGEDEVARLYDARSGRLMQRFPHSAVLLRVWLSPDGTLAATSSAMNEGTPHLLQVWDVRTGAVVGNPVAFNGNITATAFLPGNRFALAFSEEPERRIRIWEVETGELVAEPRRCWFERLIVGESGRAFAAVDYEGPGRPSGGMVLGALPYAPGPAPAWLPDLAEAIAGVRLDRQGALTPTADGLLSATRKRILEMDTNEPLAESVQWLFAGPAERGWNPHAAWTVADPAGQGSRKTRTGLQADLLDVPNHADTLGKLAWSRARDPRFGPGPMPSEAHWSSPAQWYAGQAIELAPDSAMLRAIRAAIAWRAGRIDEAEQSVTRALELDPEYPAAILTSAFILRSGAAPGRGSGHTSGSDSALGLSEAGATRVAWVSPKPGADSTRSQDKDAHEDAYALFLEYLESARQAVAEGREEQLYSGSMLQSTAEVLDAPTLVRQAQYEMIRGDYTQENEIIACWTARRAMELAPDAADILNPCARVLTLLGQAEVAERLVTAALERHPDDETLHTVLANICAHADKAGAEPELFRRGELRLVGEVPLGDQDLYSEEP